MRHAMQDQWWQLLSGAAVGNFERRGHHGQCSELWLGQRQLRASDALALHEAITCAVSMPKLIDTCFVMQDWCRTLRLMRWPFVREHIYRVRM